MIFSPEFIKQKIAEVESKNEINRFNKGIAGRGKVGLSDAQKDKIRSLATYFPSADFSLLGL